MKRMEVGGAYLACVLALSGCSQSPTRMEALSAGGSIEQDAPVKALARIHIAAPPEAVWALLVNAPLWPTWCPQIESVEPPARLAIGTRFAWKTGGSTIHSEVHLFEPQHRLSWTGTAFPARAVHVWELDATPDGGTQVTVKESMSGPLMKQLYPSDKLEASEKDWLTAMKAAAEKHTLSVAN